MAHDQRGRTGAVLSTDPADHAPPRWVPSALQRERDAFRRSRSVRSTALAAVSTVVVVVVGVLAVTATPGWPRIRASSLNPDSAVAAVPDVLRGLWLNVRVMVGCGAVIFLLRSRAGRGAHDAGARPGAAAVVRHRLHGPVPRAAGDPRAARRGLRRAGAAVAGAPPSGFLPYGCLALVLTYSAYVAEVLRAGIESIHPSQRAAARSLGLSHAQTLRFVVLPQAVRRVLPDLMNDLVSLQKDSGLLSVLAVVDAVYAARILSTTTGDFTPYLVAGAFFVLLTIPMARATDAVARRWGTPFAGGAV